MKRIKNYLVFTSLLYRILTFVLLPIVTVGLYYLLRKMIPQVGLVIVMSMVVMAEIILDIWLFGGIQVKGTQMLEYLKTSGRGRMVLRDALVIDLIRRFITIAGIMGVCYLLEGLEWNNLQVVAIRIYSILIAYTLMVAGVLIARYEGIAWVNIVLSYAAVFLAAMSFLLPGLSQYIMVYDLVVGVLAVLVSILTVKAAMKKVEGSYYDR